MSGQSNVYSGKQSNHHSIEEAKNSEAEEETPNNMFSPKGSKVKTNNTLSGEGIRDHRRESNGLAGLIKKIRGNSNGPDNDSLDSHGILKKQTPISDRSDKPARLSKIMPNG